MQADWQNLVALALVALAAGYIAWRAWCMVRHRGGGCGTGGGCNTCSHSQDTSGVKSSLPLVELKTIASASQQEEPNA